MKIALINENSQAAKNEIIFKSLKETVEPMGHTVFNYGMLGADDAASLTYVQNGLLGAILLNSKACDYVVSGCGTGMGAMLALNAFPNVLCGHVSDPSEAMMFAQINDGNAISLPYAKGFGWGAEVNLGYMFDKLFGEEGGQGFPRERAVPMRANRVILNQVKEVTHNSMLDILKNIDQEFLYNTINRDTFKKYFFENAQDQDIIEYCKKVLG